MGEVYKAKDTRLERSVAIKVLPAHLSADPERRARFAREAKAIAGLNHPHIRALHDVGREGDVDFLVMEYVDGTRLASTYPVAKALEYTIQIVDALRASHQNGVIHCDLKPANVMVTPEGQVKVLDFGLAKHLAAPAAPEAATVSAPSEEASLTRHGVAVGTVAVHVARAGGRQAAGRALRHLVQHVVSHAFHGRIGPGATYEETTTTTPAGAADARLGPATGHAESEDRRVARADGGAGRRRRV